MICRETPDGWTFIKQPAHAWMAGQLAGAWKNGNFYMPKPKESVILATTLHDIGWAEWDAEPRLHPDGRPVNFLETTFEETVPIWDRAISIVGQIG